jgi:hypothetical protein
MVDSTFEGIDLVDRMNEISKRMRGRIDKINSEEATKNALVMPFINHVLGYNVFDPSEVVPEYTADVGTKKGEKVDYAIIQNDEPIILFECKKYRANLDDEPASQLYRYFSVSQARFGVLTDGIIYRFYADLDESNKMDSKPFFDIDMLEFTDAEVEGLRRFTKAFFNLDQILSTAKDLKYTRELKRLLSREWSDPSEEFVRYLAGQVYAGQKTKGIIEQFSRITKRALSQFLNEEIKARLTSALQDDSAETADPENQTVTPDNTEKESDDGIVTTEDEWLGYFALKAILMSTVSPDRVTIRDRKTYCGILLDDNARKPICRLHFNRKQKAIGLFDGESEERVQVDSINDILRYQDRLIATVKAYDAASPEPTQTSESDRPPDSAYGSLSKVTEETFLHSLDENGCAVYSRILDLAKTKSMPVHWGSRGFSLNVDIGGTHVAVCYAYPPNSVFRQTLRTALREGKTAVPEQELQDLHDQAVATGLFTPDGGKLGQLKYLIERRLTETEMHSLLAWCEAVERAVLKHGLR